MPASLLNKHARHESLESRVRGNLQARFGEGPTEKDHPGGTSQAAYSTLQTSRSREGQLSSTHEPYLDTGPIPTETDDQVRTELHRLPGPWRYSLHDWGANSPTATE
jgi:hypothetical protein